MRESETDNINLDLSILTPVVRAALDDRAALIIDWSCRTLDYAAMAPSSGGLYVVSGNAELTLKKTSWSVVLKMAVKPDGSSPAVPMPFGSPTDPRSQAYWKREPLAYASRILEDLVEDFRAPKCFGVTETIEGDYRIWLEMVEDNAFGRPWPQERFFTSGLHLGRFNGTFATTRALPDFPWLVLDRLPIRYEQEPAAIPRMRAASEWENPLVKRYASASLIQRVLKVWDARDMLLSLHAPLPLTLSHIDTNCANLLASRLPTGGVETIAVDWAWLGIDPLGSDMSQLICGSLRRFEVQLDHAPQLVESVLTGYLQGLREVGCNVDPSLLAQAWVPVALDHIYGTAQLFLNLSDARASNEESLWQRPISEIIEQRVAFLSFLLATAESALQVAST